MREIIEAQGGDPKIKPEDIKIGDKSVEIKSEKDGKVLWINNSDVVLIAKKAGAPKDKGAGLQLNVKMGDIVKRGETLFTIYAESNFSLNDALKLAKELKPIVIGKHFEEKMLLEKVFIEIPRRKIFMLER